MKNKIIEKNKTIESVIEMLGGTQKSAAEAIGVSQPSVMRWLHGRCGPDARAAIQIEKVTGGKVTRAQLRPDIFG